MAEEIRVNAEALRRCVTALFAAVGVPADEAAIVGDCLVEADLSGFDSHGITRIGNYVEHLENGGFGKACAMTLIREAPATAYYDANGSIGFPCAVKAMEAAVAKAKNVGAAAVMVRNSNHYGAAGYYTRMAAREGLIGFTCTNGPPAIAPWGSVERYHGTNPFSVAFPTRDEPIVLDMATSVVARGKIMLAARKGEDIPAGWALNAEGRPTTDAKEALDGSVFPMGGVKGYGLALAVDVMSGLLAGSFWGFRFAEFGNAAKPQNVGQFFMALNIDHFAGRDGFLEDIESLKAEIRSLPRKEGVDKVFLPGEPEFEKRRRHLAEGIPVSRAVYDDLKRICAKYGVPVDF